MTFFYDLDSASWSVDEDELPTGRSWLPAAAGVIVLVGSMAAAAALQFLGR